MIKVSVITACYNSAKTILDNMQSVQHQTYANIEHVVVDGLSKDDTLSIIHRHQNAKTSVVSEKDQGIYDAINKGIQRASGDIIGLMHSDDVFHHPQVVEKVVAVFNSDLSIQAVYGDLLYVQADNTQKIIRTWKSKQATGQDFYWGWMPAHPTMYVRKEVFQQYGLYRTDMRISADYEWMLRLMLKHQIKSKYLPQFMVNMRVGGVSNSSWKNRILANQEDRRAWQVNGLKPCFFTMLMKPLRKLGQFFS